MREPAASTATQSDSASLSSRRLLAFGALFVALSAAGVYAIYVKVAERTFTFDMRLLSWPVIVGAAVLLCVYFITDALRLYYTLRALNSPMPLRQVMRLVFINLFFSNVTPMATGGGFAQVWYMQRWGTPIGTAMAATTVRTVLAVLFIFTSTPLALLLLQRLAYSSFSNALIISLTVFTAAYIGFFAILLLRTHWLITPITALLQALTRTGILSHSRYRRLHFSSRREMLRFAQGFRTYLRGSRGDICLSVMCTCLFLITLFSFPALLLWALGYSIDYFSVLGVMVTTTFIMYFSPTPGASGIAEGAFGHFFAGMVTGNHLVLVTVAWRILTIYIGMGIGLFITHHEIARGPRR